MLKVMAAMFYVIVGGAGLVWMLNKLCEALDTLINLTVEDYIGFAIFMLVVTAVALNL